jgi:hypothetical protein
MQGDTWNLNDDLSEFMSFRIDHIDGRPRRGRRLTSVSITVTIPCREYRDDPEGK